MRLHNLIPEAFRSSHTSCCTGANAEVDFSASLAFAHRPSPPPPQPVRPMPAVVEPLNTITTHHPSPLPPSSSSTRNPSDTHWSIISPYQTSSRRIYPSSHPPQPRRPAEISLLLCQIEPWDRPTASTHRHRNIISIPYLLQILDTAA